VNPWEFLMKFSFELLVNQVQTASSQTNFVAFEEVLEQESTNSRLSLQPLNLHQPQSEENTWPS